jgi:hypothetical protein
MTAVRREDVNKVKEENKERKKEIDKRNLDLIREGLTNVKDFVNKEVILGLNLCSL